MGFVLRRPILWASRQGAIKRSITALPVTARVVRRFVAGETTADAVRAVAELRKDGIWATIDHLGEDVTSEREVADNVAEAHRLVDALVAAGLAGSSKAENADAAQGTGALEGSIELSLKLSALGQGLSEQLAARSAREIIEKASAAGIWVNLDMEDHTTTDRTLALLAELRRDHPTVGVAVQAMLRRTPSDLDRLCGKQSRVRLVKGAYDEPEDQAWQSKDDIDRAYAEGLDRLFAGDGYPMVGSHDPAMISHALSLALRHSRSMGDFEVQMLYGIRTDEQRRLAGLGHRVRAYVPYGTDWYGYFTRRLAERPANLMFFLRSFRHER